MENTISDTEEPVETLILPMEDDDVDVGKDNHSSPSDTEFVNQAIEDEEEVIPKFDLKPSHEAKIRELLRNINSIEVKLCTDGSKEFMKLLRGSSGGDLLYEYVRTSSKLAELLDAWNRRRGKPGLSYILSLISVILGHPDGRYVCNDSSRVAISRVLDKFARSIVEERLEDVYKEINSKERKRQKAALLLVASVVRRGSLLAAEVAKSFDFKLPILPKLSGYRRKLVERRVKHSTRDAFIEFAMSFLEVGKPALLRWVLQQREIFSGILRGLGNDDDETVVYVLSTLRDRVLTPDSLVSPGLRSVLFGNVTLEQLVAISERDDGGLGAKLAYEVLVMVCTDPSNGLMPDLNRHPNPLKGNVKRLVALMKKLKAVDVPYHRSLLLAIVNGRPLLGSSYLDEFPYNLEDNTSPTWVSAVTLAANVIRSVKDGISRDFLNQKPSDLLNFENSDVQSVFKCMCPHTFNRLIFNKGLLHSDSLIKHSTLRLLLEVLKFFSFFVDSLNLNGLSSLRQRVQDEVRILLPDPQVLFTLLSSKPALKRTSNSENVGKKESSITKKLKVDVIDEEVDILVGGLNPASEDLFPRESEKPRKAVSNFLFDDENHDDKFIEIWGSVEDSFSLDVVKDANVHFSCKVLEALKIYHGTLRAVLEVSYDFLKILPSNPLEVPSILLQSLLSTLIEHFSCSHDFSPTMLPPIYKYLPYFLNLSIHSPLQDIKEQGYALAKAAMRSTGAFDYNPWEIGAWFKFLPGYIDHDICRNHQEIELFQSFSSPVVSFLCDAVSTIGNNLVKHLGLLKRYISNPEVVGEHKVEFSPLVICVVDKCLRLLCSGSGTFTLPEKSMISLYVCDTLKYLLQTQVEAGTLAGVIHQLLSERIEDHTSIVVDAQSSLCEWRPLISLLFFSRSILHQETLMVCSISKVVEGASSSFATTIAEVKSLLSRGNTEVLGISKALYYAILSSSADDILAHLPSIVTVSGKLPGFHRSFMSYFFHDQNLINHVAKMWPGMFASSLGMSVKTSSQLRQAYDNHTSTEIPFTDFESLEYASVVFGSFLKEAPFYMLFPAVITGDLEHFSEFKELLVLKLANLTVEQIVSSVRLVLFWFHQIHSLNRNKPSEQQELLSNLCYELVECILAQLSKYINNSGSSTAVPIPVSRCAQEVIKTVFFHPAVAAVVNRSSGLNIKFSEETLKNTSEGFLHLCGKSICKMELHVLKLLTMSCDYLSAMCGGKNSLFAYDECKENILRTFKHLVQWIFMILKERFNLWCRSGDITFVPVLFAVFSLLQFISPIELLEIADWMLAGLELSDSVFPDKSSVSPVCLALSIACAAFDVLSEYMKSPNAEPVFHNYFWVIKEENFNANLFESIYFRAFESSTRYEIAFADICLLKALRAARSLTYKEELHPVSMKIMRVIASTPLEIISHCICRTNNVKAKLLLLMIEISPLHLSTFGHYFFRALSKDVDHCVDLVPETNYHSLSNEDYVMLLPAAVSYLCSSWRKLEEQSSRHIEYVFSFYSRILLDGFHNWKYFVSQTAFQMECGNILLLSVENLHDLFSNSLLGRVVMMLHWYFTSNEDTLKERLKLFRSVCLCSDEMDDFLDFDLMCIDSYSVEQLLNLVNRAVAKISLSLTLLFPDSNINHLSCKAHESHGKSTVGYQEVDSLGVGFLDKLVCVWQNIVKKLPSTSDNAESSSGIYVLMSYLEIFILQHIYKFSIKMHDYLIQMGTLPFLEKMAKTSLLHRFGDPTTFENIRLICSVLSDGNLPTSLFLQLLLGHSQLAPTINTITQSSSMSLAGMAVKPISSLLRSLKVPVKMHITRQCERYKRQLEVIKLLRLLFHLTVCKGNSVSADDLGVNSKELLCLLLPSYGATISDIDREIYGLLSEIESASGMEHSLLADLDYLWGSAALRVVKETAAEHVLLNNDIEDAKECRRSQFRDNLPIDPTLLIQTILHFPYRRTISTKPMLVHSVLQVENTVEGQSAELEMINCYDPIFVLSFSIHTLSMGYLDPVEFSGLGLLAIALVSIASPEDEVRKLGYDALGKFTYALKECVKKKEVTRLKLLLTYVQNGIEEPWQRIPTIAAVFVAEASIILLDPSHDHYPAISKFLMRSPRMNLKGMPLFHDVIWSSSLNFRADRLWMIRLLYAGINMEDDAQIYIRNSVLEILLSVFASPLSDNEAKELTLQVVKKCVKLQKMAHYLVEQCCLISWLSSVLSLSLDHSDVDDNIFKQLIVLLEVIHEIISSRTTLKWLQNDALEQLSEISRNLFKLLVGCSKLFQEATDLILEIIVSTLKISQKREVNQPHFTMSIRCLYQLFYAVDRNGGDQYGRCANLGLIAVVSSLPPTMFAGLGQEELSQLLKWAVTTALRSDPPQPLQESGFSSLIKMALEENTQSESLVSTLLRWLIASVIQWRVSCSNEATGPLFLVRGENEETLLSFMRSSENESVQTKQSSGIAEILAATIFYLQQHLGMKCKVLPSVVAALSILLLSDRLHSAGSATTVSTENTVPSLWSKIRCPSEANPSWRWSSSQPWVDLNKERTNQEKLIELHACQKLLAISLGILRKKPSNYQLLSPRELDSSGLFEWEGTNLCKELE